MHIPYHSEKYNTNNTCTLKTFYMTKSKEQKPCQATMLRNVTMTRQMIVHFQNKTDYELTNHYCRYVTKYKHGV